MASWWQKTESRVIPSRHCVFLILLLISGASLTACDTILAPPDDPVVDNPIDPGSPTFVPPETNITSGPANGSTVDSARVVIEWEGNEGAVIFQSRLNQENWADWSTGTTRILEYLDEGTYTFSVRSAYPDENNDPAYMDSTAATVTFTVDAVQSSSMRLSPRLVEPLQFQTFQLELIAEDVTDLMGVRATLSFNSSALSVEQVTAGDFLASNGGTVISQIITDNGGGTIEINLAVADGTPAGVSGTGTLVTLQFMGLQVGNTTITIQSASSDMRNHLNQAIAINNLIGSTVRIR